MTKYTIELQAETLESEYVPLYVHSTKAAMQSVKHYIRTNPKPESTLIYLQFFRSADRQKGYINPDGHASLTGKPWNLSEDDAERTEIEVALATIASELTLEDYLAWCDGEVSEHLENLMLRAGVTSLVLDYAGGVSPTSPHQIHITGIELSVISPSSSVTTN